jgi:ribonuclease P/MRP protein subunit POP1
MPLPQLVNSKYRLSKMPCALQSILIYAIRGLICRAALAQRAFQDVPRTLRRRSASHNVKRVPRPLREKARREMAADGTKPSSKPRGRVRLAMEKKRLAGKSVPKDTQEMDMDVDMDNEVTNGMVVPKLKPRKVTTGKFANRQEDKTWLPTHLYHAKRSRVDHRWGFSLPITPTEKSFRPTYRASHHSGFIAFDTSYFATLFIHGTEDKVRQTLDMVIEPGSAAASKRYSSGKRSCETVLYRHGEFPRGMIGPVLVLWGVGEGERQVMIRVHPACVDQVWEELHFCSKQVGDVRIEDARFEIGAIDLFGPLSTEVLFSVLNVGKGVCSKLWEQLKGLGDPGSLPLGAVLNLDLTDPRTTYPPP